MIDCIFKWLNNILQETIYLSVTASFLWGILSVLLSPCHLSSIPLIIGHINRGGIPSEKAAFLNSILFSFGIIVTITITGTVTGLLGGLIGDIGTIGNYMVILVFLISGLYLLDIIHLDWNFFRPVKINTKGYMAAFILGMLFGAGLGPCTFAYMAPVLSIVFQYSASNLPYAVMLLGAFAAGHCLVLITAGTLSAKVGKYLNWADSSNALNIFKKACGVLVILGGIYFIYTTDLLFIL